MRLAVLVLASVLLRRRGITCRSLASGHGFRVSGENRETF